MGAVSGGLRGGRDFGGSIEKIDLYGDAEMAASAPDDVVLVAGSDLKSVEIAFDGRTDVDGIASPDDVAGEGGCPRRPERNDDHIEMGELSVHFASEGGVGAEVQVLDQINRISIALGPDGARRVGVKPAGVEADLVLIKLLLFLSVDGCRKP